MTKILSTVLLLGCFIYVSGQETPQGDDFRLYDMISEVSADRIET